MPAKILVIEDAPETLALYEAILTERGFAVMTAVNGQEALQKVQKERPHLIIVDILMPEMDGFMFFKEIRKIREMSHIPIFVITVRARMEDTFRALGVEEFIVKPFDSQELLDKIGTRLGFRPEGADQSEAAAKEEDPSQATATITQKQTKKFLFIGTSESVLKKISALIPKDAATVDTVIREKEALDKALIFDPDILVIETLLSNRSAADLVAKIKNHPKLKAKSVLLYSVFDRDNLQGVSPTQKAIDIENSKKACLMAGADDALGGFEENHFRSVLQKYLS